MNKFVMISEEEMRNDVVGGGVISAVAGGLAGATIGVFVGLIPSIVTGDTKYIKQSVVACTSVGVWAGLGAPLL